MALPTQAWTSRYNALVSTANDQPYAIAISRTGELTVAGRTVDSANGSDFLIVKYSRSDGSVLWRHPRETRIHPSGEARAICADFNGDIIVVGPAWRDKECDWYAAKHDGISGDVLWQRRIAVPDGECDTPTGVKADLQGDVLVFSVRSTSGILGGAFIRKLSASDGTIRWTAGTDKMLYGFGKTLDVDDRDNAVVVGLATNGLWIAKYANLDGTLMWQQVLGSTITTSANFALSAPNQTSKATLTRDLYRVGIAVDLRGDIVCGATLGQSTQMDYYTAKCSGVDGRMLWEKRYDGPASDGAAFRALAVDRTGNVVVTGVSSNGRDEDYYTAKYAALDGTLLWERRYNAPVLYNSDRAEDLAIDASGDVFVTGTSLSVGTSADIHTLKYASLDGGVLWEKRYTARDSDYAIATGTAEDGLVYVAAASLTRGSSILTDNYDIYTVQYDSRTGEILWQDRFGTPTNLDDIAKTIVLDSFGGSVVAGNVFNGINDDVHLLKYGTKGDSVVWERQYDSGFNDKVVDIVCDSAGGVAITASLAIDYGAYYTAKYSVADGTLLWERFFNGPGNSSDIPIAIGTDGVGNVFVTGTSSNSSGADWHTLKYSARDGRIVWECRNGSEVDNDFATALAVDPLGNVAVAGFSIDRAGGQKSTIAKFSSSDGATLWKADFPGSLALPSIPSLPPRRYDGPKLISLAADSQGDLVALGQIGNGRDQDIVFGKYCGIDGHLFWNRLYAGHPGGDDLSRGLALGRNGEVVVIGNSSNGDNFDIYTAKHSSAEGSLVWERRFDGASHLNDTVVSVSATDNGNVFIAGTSESTSTKADYYLAQYSAIEGALMWEFLYDGPAHQEDHVSSMAANHAGTEVAVTGSSKSGAHTGFDFATILYRDRCPRLTVTLATGGIRIEWTGTSTSAWVILRSADLLSWNPVGSVTTEKGGSAVYLDSNPLGTCAFYQIRLRLDP